MTDLGPRDPEPGEELDLLRAASRIFEELVDSSAAEREESLAALRDPRLADRVRRLLAADEVSEERLGKPFSRAASWLAAEELAEASSQRTGERLGAWRILRLLGKGGMGEVYLAERADGAFDRRVALKLLKRGLDSEEIVSRFLAERRILARLDHPGIAQLVDGGLAPDGRPYFALELVDGQSITDWCAERRVPLEARLRLLLEVVAAVDFAHRNLVVHRDLKPSNVLVTASGAVKLLDFGIAKFFGPDELDATRTGARLLTPRYAAPEQILGEPVTTATDVHALGLLLWELVTGEPARRAASAASMPSAADLERESRTPPSARILAATAPGRAPLEGSSPRARRRLARRIAGDLDKVVLKALRHEPARRYASAAAFGEDLVRFLESRPVLAREGALSYRAAKFALRHRAAMTAAALVTISLAAGIFATLRQARIAEHARALAERRFSDVRRLANVALFDVHAALDNVAGAMAARRLLVATALDYLDDLAREAGDDPELLAELAAAYERTAEIQGMPSWPSEGRTGDALASLERALELRRLARLAKPAANGADLEEARLLVRIGTVLAARGSNAEALGRHREALRFYEAATPAETRDRLERIQARIAIGDDLWQLGQLPAAEEEYRLALDHASAARAADPQSVLAIRQVGVVEQRLGDAAAERADWALALRHHEASLAIDRELAERVPADAEVRRDLGTDLSRLGVASAALGRFDEALARHRAATALREELLEGEPEDARALDDAAESRFEAGRALLALGRAKESAYEIELGLVRRRRLTALDPSNARWQESLAAGLADLAEVERARGRHASSGKALGEALAVRRQLARESPDDAANRTALAELEASLRPAAEAIEPKR